MREIDRHRLGGAGTGGSYLSLRPRVGLCAGLFDLLLPQRFGDLLVRKRKCFTPAGDVGHLRGGFGVDRIHLDAMRLRGTLTFDFGPESRGYALVPSSTSQRMG